MKATNKRSENLSWPDQNEVNTQLGGIRELAKELRTDYPTDTPDEPTNWSNKARNRRNTLIRAQFLDNGAFSLISGPEWLELFDLLGFSIDKETRKRFVSHLNWYSFWYADFKPRLSNKYAQRIHWYVHNFLFCLRNKLHTEKDYHEGKYSLMGRGCLMEIEQQPATPAEMPQILNCDWQTVEHFKAIPNIAKLANAGVIINGVSWHTEYLNHEGKMLARVDNVDIDKFQGSGLFGKTAMFESWEDAVTTTIELLTA